MRHLRKVKIVATLGPASSTYDVIKDLHQAGADVFRLNMSHGSHAEIRERHRIIREIEKELASPIAILADLQGPKLRVGTLQMARRHWLRARIFSWIWTRAMVMLTGSACRIVRFSQRLKWAHICW